MWRRLFVHPGFGQICLWWDKNGDISKSKRTVLWRGKRLFCMPFPLFSWAKTKQCLSHQATMPHCKTNIWLSITVKQPYLSKWRLSLEEQPIPLPSLIWPHSTVWQIAPQVHGSKSKLLYVIEANVISFYHFFHACLALKVSWDGCSQSRNLFGPSPPEMIALTRTHKHNLPQEIESRCLNVKLKWDSRAAAPPTLMKMKT